MLAVVADFVEDAEAAVEYLADGRIRAVREASDLGNAREGDVVMVKAEPGAEQVPLN